MGPQPTPLERLLSSGITPERALGQNFLIDPNILDVIERSASLSSDDVILEVGPGLGVLTGLLVARCAAVHCIEVDKRLGRALDDEFGNVPGFQLHLADAVRFDLARLEPRPGKFISNLPYNVATPLVMKSFEELPSVGLWCLMLQKEIASRLFAATGSAGYGSVSVMTRLVAEKVLARSISRKVFYPVPRVESTLLVFKRRRRPGFSPERFAAIKEIVQASFAHRRKKLSNSLAEAAPGPGVLKGLAPTEIRQLAGDILNRMGLEPAIRPQALSPEQFEEFASLLNDARAVKGRHA